MRKKTATLTNDRAAGKPASELQAAVAPGPSSLVETSQPPSEDAVRLRAYLKWQGAGKPDGDGVRFWLEAEQELRRTEL